MKRQQKDWSKLADEAIKGPAEGETVSHLHNSYPCVLLSFHRASDHGPSGNECELTLGFCVVVFVLRVCVCVWNVRALREGTRP